MKINGVTQNYTGIQKKVVSQKDPGKDQVILGGGSEMLNIMEQPLVSMKSNTGEDIGNAILRLGGIASGVGVLAAGAGVAGRTFGGPAGVVLAAGASALLGGAVFGKMLAGTTSGDETINKRGFAVGAATMGVVSLAGAGLSGVGSPLTGGILAAGAGAFGGGPGFLGGLLFTEGKFIDTNGPADDIHLEEGEGSINDNFAQYPNSVVENPGTGEVRPLGEKVLSEKLKKINNPATSMDESISLWKSYKKDAESYLINPVSFGRDFSDFSYVKTNDPNIQVAGFPKPESLSGSMREWTNYIQEKNPDGTISLTPLQPEQMEEGSFNLEHYTEGHLYPDGGLELKFTSQASSILITEGINMFVKVDGKWVKNPAGKI